MSTAAPKVADADVRLLSPETDRESLRLSFAVALVVYLTYFFTTTRLEENLQTLGLLALLGSVVCFPRFALAWGTWALVAATLAGGILLRPLDVPNHHFVLTYAALAFAACLSAPPARRAALLRHNFRWIIVALMGIATVQRFFQPSFTSGDYLGYEIAMGGFLWPLLKLVPSLAETMVQNRELVETFRQTPPSELASVTLDAPLPFLPLLAKGFMVSILAIEAWICLAMAFFPRRLVTHLSIMGFGLTLIALRQELTFIAVIGMLGLFTLEPHRRSLRYTYAVLIVFSAAAVMKTVNLPGPLQ